MVTLALDWTPNINHIGFFIAQELKFYEKYGVQVKIIDASEDNYAITPVKKVELGMADFALCPTESVISYKTKKTPFDLCAVAAVLQQDLSAIAVTIGSGINSPRALDGKVYASYKAKYEDEIIRQMIKNDGGKGEIKIAYPDKLGIWNTVIEGKADATWIFLNWEGVAMQKLSQNSGINMRYFTLDEYNIPYSYSPVLVAGSNSLNANKEKYRKFVAAAKKGYEYAASNPKEAVALFQKYVPESDSHIDLALALDASREAFVTDNEWGFIDMQKVRTFVNWLNEHELETNHFELESMFSNGLLSKR